MSEEKKTISETEEERNKQLERLKRNIQEISTFLEKELDEINIKLGKNLSFNIIKEETDKLPDFLNKVTTINFKEIPLALFKEIVQKIESINSTFSNIKSFETYIPNNYKNNPNGYRREIINKLNIAIYEAFKNIRPYFSSKDQLVWEINSLKEVADDLGKKVRYLEAQTKDIDVTYKNIQVTEGKVALGKYKKQFADEADKNKTGSKCWLVFVGVFSAFLIATILLFLTGLKFEKDLTFSDPNIIQTIIAKFFILSLGYYLFSWSLRNFNLSKHNYIINTHKHISLLAIISLVDNLNETDRVSALLLGINLILNEPNSGFLKKEIKGNPVINRVSDILKIINEKSSVNK